MLSSFITSCRYCLCVYGWNSRVLMVTICGPFVQQFDLAILSLEPLCCLTRLLRGVAAQLRVDLAVALASNSTLTIDNVR